MPPGTTRTTSGGQAPLVAQEADAPEDLVRGPEGATGGLARPGALEASATEARASGPEAVAEGQVPPGAPKAATQGALLSTRAVEDRSSRPGRLRLNLEALRKRKGSPSSNSDTYWPLKQRKYIAVDE